MSAYQLRMKRELSLEDFLGSVAKEIWNLVSGCLDRKKIQPDDFVRLETATKMSLQPYLRAYDLCGTFPECTNQVECAPRLDFDDQIFLLSLPGSFPAFIEQLSVTTLDSISHLARPNFSALIYDSVQDVFRRNFAQHLYYNPACRRIPACKDSLPIHPVY